MRTKSESRLWFGRVLAWSTVPGEPNLRETRYAGREHVIERLGRSAANCPDKDSYGEVRLDVGKRLALGGGRSAVDQA